MLSFNFNCISSLAIFYYLITPWSSRSCRLHLLQQPHSTSHFFLLHQVNYQSLVIHLYKVMQSMTPCNVSPITTEHHLGRKSPIHLSCWNILLFHRVFKLSRVSILDWVADFELDKIGWLRSQQEPYTRQPKLSQSFMKERNSE